MNQRLHKLKATLSNSKQLVDENEKCNQTVAKSKSKTSRTTLTVFEAQATTIRLRVLYAFGDRQNCRNQSQ
jgi:hypothetical protein